MLIYFKLLPWFWPLAVPARPTFTPAIPTALAEMELLWPGEPAVG